MNGPDHYREAEFLLARFNAPAGPAEGIEKTLRLAQVHATLALAAAVGGQGATDLDPLLTACPTCGATSGQPCRIQTPGLGQNNATSPHEARIRVANGGVA